MSTNELLKMGLSLPLMESFYSIQGEGYHAGKAAFFARIGGCDVGCRWCDVKESWNAAVWPLTRTDTIVQQAKQYPSRSVVVTGGEPLLYNLDYLCRQLTSEGYTTFLETSGAHPLSGTWDWICLSPKRSLPPVADLADRANELKVIIGDMADFEWAEENALLVQPQCMLFLQPEWSARNNILPEIVDYIKKNPKWMISLQLHKYLRIP